MKITIAGIKEEFRRLNKLADKEEAALLAIASKQMVVALAENTPVDTGKAQAGWKSREEGDHVIIENDVEYIESLNSGHSKQAPAFFVEQTLSRFGELQGVVSKSP